MITFDQALDARRGPAKLVRVAPSRRFEDFCAKHRVPRDLAKVLSRHSFTRSIDFGAVAFDPVNAIPRANGGHSARCIAQRLLIVGSGANGDPVVVDLRERSPTMAFVRHDEFWEDDEIAPRDCLAKAPIGLATFFFAAAKLADFPCDSYAVDDLSARYWKNIEQRAHVEARDGEGNTPLFDAVMGMRWSSPTFAPSGPAMTRELLKAGADKDRANKHRLSPAKLASDVSFRLEKWLRVTTRRARV